jgi:hypothetical protein
MPKPNKVESLRCACENKRWERAAGVAGTAAEAEMLKAFGFWFTHSATGAAYYVGSLNRLIWFNADGTWSSSQRLPRAGMTLEEYLKETSRLASA